MAQYTAYANYVVYFSDEAEYQFALGVAGGYSLEVAPFTAASLFGLVDGVHYNIGGPSNPDKGMYTVSYSISVPGSEIGHPSPSGVTLDADLDFVIVPGQASSFSPTPGPDLKLIWSCFIQRVGGTGNVAAPERAPIPQRRWIWGCELDTTAEGGQSGGSNNRSRDASRTLDGIGWGLRSPNNVNYTRRLDEYGAIPGNAWESWERIYIRPRTIGGGDIDIWRCGGSPSPAAGIQMRMKTDLSIDIYNVTAFSVFTLKTNVASAFVLNEWTKLDIILQYANPGGTAASGRFRLFINGVAAADFTVANAEGGLGGANSTHADSMIGTQTAGATTWELDYDDWHNAIIPNVLGVEQLDSIDFILGTHMRKLLVNSGTSVNWAGQLQSMNQLMNPENGLTGSLLTSTTALATLDGVTNLNSEYSGLDSTGLVFCSNAIMVCSYTQLASGAVAGRLGLRLAAGVAQFPQTIVESTSGRFNDVLYRGTGTDIVVDPTTVEPLHIVYEKANNAVNTTVRGVMGIVELIGVWGPEDDGSDLPAINIIHNAWYPALAQAFLGPVQDGPVAAVGGTYVGNGTTRTVALPLPAHFIWIRSLSAANAGAKWYATSLGGHQGVTGGVNCDHILRCDYDFATGTSSFTVVGSSADMNQNAVTYQYIAFCDPAFLYNICGAFHHATAVTNFTNPIYDSLFTPVCAFFQPERLDNDNVTRLGFKGPGMAGNSMRLVDGTAIANGASFGAGQIISGTNLHSQSVDQQISYSAWRQSNNCGSEMLQIFSYVGDGTGNRVINFPTVTGRCGLLICVQPDTNAQMVTRDPSDAGASSRTVANNSAVANGIIAVGTPGQFTVGSLLNANGITYSVFVILGSTAGMVNGTFFPSNCLGDELVLPPEPPLPGINVLSQGGLVLGGTPAITLLQDVGGLYTIVPGKRNDTLYDRQSGQPSVDVAIPNPRWGTGYIGG